MPSDQLFRQVHGLASYREEISEELAPDPRRLARASDPETSKEAAQAHRYRRGSQKYQLLVAYLQAHQDGLIGLTDEDAASRAGLTQVGFWKRCSDLRSDGMIAPTGRTFVLASGLVGQICSITPAGILLLSDG